MFDRVMTDGFKNVWENDKESQINFLTTIGKDVRGMDPKILIKAEGMFIPNKEYMVYHFGPEIVHRDLDCYDSFGNCIWCNNIIFPIYDILGRIVGISGFNPVNKLISKEEMDVNLNAYRTSNSRVFEKTKHFFSQKGVLKKSIIDGYIVIIDGVFDTISLFGENINSAGLLGSYVSEEQLAYLTLVDRVIICEDGDVAGSQLAKRIKRRVPHAVSVKFNKHKDVDSILKSEEREKFLTELKEVINAPIHMDKTINFHKYKFELVK